MIAVGLLVLSAVIGIIVSSSALPVAKALITAWIRFYTAFAPPDSRERRRSEVLRDIYEQINSCREENYRPSEIAPKLIYRWVTGLVSDVTWCASFVPALTAYKIVEWSSSLRHYKIPAALVAGVAILGLMNYGFFTSHNSQSFGTWFMVNTICIATIVLLWKHKHPIARRIFQAWMGIAMAGGVGIMVWMTVHFQLYTSMTFKMLMLAMITVLPTMIVVDKSWRQRLFRGKWWLIPICWAPIIAGALAGSFLIAHSIKPLLEMWEVMGLFAVGMLIVYGLIALGAYALCWLGIRGSANGLRLVASGIRRLR